MSSAAASKRLALVLLGALGLLWPAMHNGYPLTFQDSAWYLTFIIGHIPIHPGRTIGYSLFANALTWWPSLWPVIVGQAVITSALIVRSADLAAGRGRSGLKLAAIGLAVILVLTGLPKYVSWVMADVMTGWIFLAGLIWMLSDEWIDRSIAVAVTALAVLAHNTHLPLAVAMASAVAIGGFTLVPKEDPGRLATRRSAAGLFAVGLLMIAWVPAINYANGIGATVLRGGSSFLMYRFIDSGVMIETLDAYCDEMVWDSCAHRDEFAGHIGRADGWFLFQRNSPFFTQLGQWQGAEQNEIVAHAFRCCWPSILSTSLAGAWEQFWRIDSRDGVGQVDVRPVRKSLHRARWAELHSLNDARQARGEPVRVTLISLPEIPIQIAFGLLAVALGGLGWRRGDRRIAFLLGSVLLFLIGNAMLCSFGSSIHDRYQGRIAWLLPWASTLAFWWWREGPVEPEAGAPEVRPQIES